MITSATQKTNDDIAAVPDPASPEIAGGDPATARPKRVRTGKRALRAMAADDNAQAPVEVARVRQWMLRDLRDHAVVYALVNLSLVMLNALLTPDLLWSLVPAVGWGIALALDAKDTLFPTPEQLAYTREWMARRYPELRESPRPPPDAGNRVNELRSDH